MKQIEITIAADGKITTKVNGVKGKGCLELTKELEKALGGAEKRTKTPEYFEPEEKLRVKTGN